MAETIFVTGVVIANGVADTDGDVLDKKDIKTIMAKYENRATDTMHKYIPNEDVVVIENGITPSEITIAGKIVPAGSWIATFKIKNPKLIECIKNEKLRGLSLGSVSEEAMTPKYWFVNKSMNYRDLKSIEDVIPLYISFVDNPANQYGFEVMEYDAYINKNNKTGETMEETKIDNEMISVSALEKIRDIFGITKAEEPAEPTEEPVAEDENASKVDELFNKLDTIIEQNNQILEAFNQVNKAEEEDDAEEPAKEEDDDESVEKAEEDKTEEEDETVEKAEDEEEDDDEEKTINKSESEETVEEDVHVDKRQTNMTENVSETNPQTTFYKRTGRDVFGRKIKN